MSGRRISEDPYTSFRFTVAINGHEVGGFNEVTGLSWEADVERFREGGVNLYERQLPGPTKSPSRLILKRGLADSDALWSWYWDVMTGIIRRKNLTISLQDYRGIPQWQWVFCDACPVKWAGPEFRAGRAEVAFESIELVHKGLDPGAVNGRTR